MHRRKYIAVLMALAFVFVGCTINQEMKPQTPQDKLATFKSFYNYQFDRYQVAVKRPSHTPDQVRILQAKYEALKHLRIAIDEYEYYINTGSPDLTTAEKAINAIMDRIENQLIE